MAWEPLGWEPVAFCENAEFPSAVLEYRFPDIPNLGDITKVDWSEYRGAVDLVVGGSPCQSFSSNSAQHGRRVGLEGVSGLMFEYIRCIQEVMPRWLVWENVRGALTSHGGEDIRCLFKELDELGYGLAWRVLDAQFFGVPQRRRRVFVVGCLGDREGGAFSLFDASVLQRDCAANGEEEEAASTGIDEGDRGDCLWCMSSARQTASPVDNNLCGTLQAHDSKEPPFILQDGKLRELTPLECERLQGFPDDWTKVPYRGEPKEACYDAPRYKAIGNSMAVPVMRWIGERIDRYEQ